MCYLYKWLTPGCTLLQTEFEVLPKVNQTELQCAKYVHSNYLRDYKSFFNFYPWDVSKELPALKLIPSIELQFIFYLDCELNPEDSEDSRNRVFLSTIILYG